MGWSTSDTTSTSGSRNPSAASRQAAFVDGTVHINGIESFWSFTKRRLAKFNGTRANFELHLKECEWRWRKDQAKMEHELWKLLV